MPLTESHVREMLAPLEANGMAPIVASAADDLEWTIVNRRLKALPLAGVWSKQEIPKEVLGRIFACFSSFLTYKVENLLVIPEKNTAVIEMRSSGVPKDGMDYENFHCLVCEFNEEQPKPKLRRVRHYLDSALLVNLLAGNEKL
ncbi:hypothetical protein JCM24511_06608 [Saitozyma sp. JCM 24511]|nr:hypothetical protein JCM24511_06608 [Saitozyma sp. JCM 24511]